MTGVREPLRTVNGFSLWGADAGIKDDRLDFGVVHSRVPCAAAGVFTRNNFPAAPVTVGREHLAGGRLQAIAVNSGNANAATGERGLADARATCRALGGALGLEPALVLPSSTGVIGRPLPMEAVEVACRRAPGGLSPYRHALDAFSRAILTTDTRPKACSVRVGPATITGVAKGAGMIEPHMATMLAFVLTDARVAPGALQAMLAGAVEHSFNRISVDSDTSTNDSVVAMANGLAGPVDEGALADGLAGVCGFLATEIARDGEGATRLIELAVSEAPTPAAALAIARSVINSPLIKTAIYGADPNWGRFVMAVGKVLEHPVPLEGLRLRFGGSGEPPMEISAESQRPEVLERIAAYLRREEVRIEVCLGAGRHSETVWGCDLTEGYIRINAEYTT